MSGAYYCCKGVQQPLGERANRLFAFFARLRTLQTSFIIMFLLDLYAGMYIHDNLIIIAYISKYKNYTVTYSTSSYRKNQYNSARN